MEAGYRPEAVYCQPDRRVGRGKKLQFGAVKKLAVEQGLPVQQPIKFDRSQNDQGQTATQIMADYQPDLLIVVAYGLILPQEILDLPRFGCVNIHASLLPRWRGAAPIQRAIQSGDKQTGITIMQMDRGLDTGNMLLKKTCSIESQDTASDLHDRLAELGCQSILEFLRDFSSAKGSPRFPGEIQPTKGVTYAHKLEKAAAVIDWSMNARAIDQQIRAFNPWPVSFSYVGQERLRIWSASVICKQQLISDGIQVADLTPFGQIIRVDKAGLVVLCGDPDALLITELQVDGSRRMSVAEFLNAKSQWFEPLPTLSAKPS
ncbi:MAG: methionyl-tRNA formyltransferase [Enterobacterales bacterium]|nr:methionyl-tRNA formyltransferase [Enterobacterales bacterium]